MIVNDLFESAYAGNTERAVARNMNRAGDDQAELNEFAPGSSGGGSDYLKELASAWYNGVFNTGSLPRGIKTQEDIERLLQRGIVCPDGKTRKLNIDYNSNFDGVVIFSDDYYEHGDLDGNDGRTGQPWGPWDHMEFADEELDEGVAEGIFGSKENSAVPLVNKIAQVARQLTPQNVNVGKQIIQSNADDILRMMSPQAKTGIEVIEQGVAEARESCPECGGPMFPALILGEKQDACYYKVKRRYKVWPSAYASGALVQCRKKGAANWGNKSK